MPYLVAHQLRFPFFAAMGFPDGSLNHSALLQDLVMKVQEMDLEPSLHMSIDSLEKRNILGYQTDQL